MKTLIAYGSWHIGARVMHRLARIPGVEIIAQARDAADTLAQVAATRPALVILDLLLSQGSGLPVLRALKRDPSAPVVIMTTGSMFPQDRRECLREGADYFFHLPGEIEALGQTVADLAGRRGEAIPG